MVNNFESNSLSKLIDFLNTSSGDFIDFRIVNNGKKKVSELLSPSLESYFTPIGEHGSQSLICYWKYKEKTPINELPIVWLDSEGTPNSVFASNVNDFLSLLPYDTGGIYDIITSWQYYNNEPENYTDPVSEYDSSALKCLIRLCKDSHPDYDYFVDWLNNNLKIKVCENPAKLIGEAIKNFPKLDHWLKEKKM